MLAPLANRRKELPALARGLDLLTRSGAGVLASHIEAHWKARGFYGIVATRYETDIPEVYGVRSNISVLGWPPRFAAEVVT